MELATPPLKRMLGSIPASPASARRRALQKLVTERGFVSVSDVSREIGISEMTVRRDFKALEHAGVITYAHGGAIIRSQTHIEPPFALRRGQNSAAKAAIGKAAVALIRPGDVIGLDVGSTVANLATLLRGRDDIGVVTNSLEAVMALSGSEMSSPDIYVLGGRLRPREGSLCGGVAHQQLAEHWLSLVFMGAAGIDAEGLYDYSPEEAEVKSILMARARERVLLCDSSKFGQRSFLLLCGLDAITALVTETDPPSSITDQLNAHGVRIIVAPLEQNKE